MISSPSCHGDLSKVWMIASRFVQVFAKRTTCLGFFPPQKCSFRNCPSLTFSKRLGSFSFSKTCSKNVQKYGEQKHHVLVGKSPDFFFIIWWFFHQDGTQIFGESEPRRRKEPMPRRPTIPWRISAVSWLFVLYGGAVPLLANKNLKVEMKMFKKRICVFWCCSWTDELIEKYWKIRSGWCLIHDG